MPILDDFRLASEFPEIDVYPRPHQPKGPSILIGGGSKAALKRVITLGDGWLAPSFSVAQMGQALLELERLAETLNGPMPSFVGLDIFGAIADTESDAWKIAGETVGQRGRENILVGSSDQVRERVEAYRDLGVTMLEVKFIYDNASQLMSMMSQFSEEVAAHF
jgi:alkanesulfonate monooxygenase SsuD/methylene tetrahydromethanopterin reductase-like flavin-dependent oxidoreductase (luciferase family)